MDITRRKFLLGTTACVIVAALPIVITQPNTSGRISALAQSMLETKKRVAASVLNDLFYGDGSYTPKNFGLAELIPNE